MPDHTQHASKKDQLAWTNKQLNHDLGEYMEAQAKRLAYIDVSCGHQSEETAATLHEQFRQGGQSCT